MEVETRLSTTAKWEVEQWFFDDFSRLDLALGCIGLKATEFHLFTLPEIHHDTSFWTPRTQI